MVVARRAARLIRSLGVRLLTALCTVLIPVLTSLPAAAAGDPGTGLVIARRWCATCHVVEAGQKQAAADAPSFANIAKRRGNDPKLADFLMDPHPKMPDMQIGREEAGDVVAYIQSLAPR
jgi:mono/diheme cytochrome c family protein